MLVATTLAPVRQPQDPYRASFPPQACFAINLLELLIIFTSIKEGYINVLSF